MINYIFNILSPEMITVGLFIFVLLTLLAAKAPHFVLALGFPALIFGGQLRYFFPVSVSATAAIFPLAAAVGALLRGYKFHFSRIEWCFLLLILMMIVSLTYSFSPIYGQEKMILFCFTMAPVIILLPNIIKTMEQLKIVTGVFCVTLFIYLIVSVALLRSTELLGRFNALHGAIVAGQIFGGTFVVSFILYNYLKNHLLKICIILLCVTSLCCSVMSGTRAIILAILFTVIFYFWFSHPNFLRYIISRPQKIYFVICFIILVIFLTPTFLNKLLPPDVYHGRYSSFHNFFHIDYIDNPQSRILNYSIALNCLVQHPFKGVGVGGYKAALDPYLGSFLTRFDPRHPIYPHNVFLEFASEQGIVGFLLFAYIIFLSFKIVPDIRKFYLCCNQNFVIILVPCLFLYGLFVAQTSLDLPRMTFLWWGLGMLIALNKLIEKYDRSLRVNSCQK